MNKKILVEYKDGLAFQVDLDGQRFMVDADEKFGGRNLGPKPKPLLLAGLGGCSGMDTVSILNKMKVENFTFKMEVWADSSDGHPSVYTTIYIDYIFEGDDVPEDKVKKAVSLSQERYCGVWAMLSKSAEMKPRIFINQKEIS